MGEELNVTFGDGKYTVRQRGDGRLYAERYGRFWRDLVGDNMVLTLAQEVRKLREENARLLEVVEAARKVMPNVIGAMVKERAGT